MPRARATTRTRRTRTRSSAIKKAEIGRFDGELKKVGFKAGDKIQALLDKAGLLISSGEEINDERGNSVKPEDEAKETTYYVTGNYKNGL